jgi:LmbE family N-acetylglucosaminyl deacetylase
VPDVVVLSPHLDDAALSIGALIARLAAGGRKVAVWTAFTQGPPLETIPPERRVFGDYSQRRAEDERAMAILGAERRWLDLEERIWREPPLARTLDIFRTPESIESFRYVDLLRAEIRGLLAEPEVTIYAPLAVGHHVDHVEVAVAALAECIAQRAWDRMRFYEDVYALGAACRRHHFVTARRHWRPLAAPSWASPRIGATLLMAARAAQGPGVDGYLPEAQALRWISVPEPVGEHQRRKLAAIAAYTSQVREFGGLHQVSPFVARGHEVLGGEPIWFARPAVESAAT